MNTKLKNRIIIWLLLFLFLFNISTIGYIFIQVQRIKKEHQQEIVFPRPPNRPPLPPNHGKGFLKRLSKKINSELNLTPEQKQIFNQLKQDFRTQTKNCIDSLHFYRQMFDYQLENTSPDYQKMQLAAEKIGEYHKKLRLNFLNLFKEFRENLNQEQKQKLAQIFQELKQKPKK